MKHLIHRISGAAAALVLSVLAAAAQQAPNLNAIPAAERKAMETCVVGVLQRLQRENASYRAVKPAVAKDCDPQLRAVLAAAIRVGQAGPCTSVDGCIDMARGRAGDEATLDYQRLTVRR